MEDGSLSSRFLLKERIGSETETGEKRERGEERERRRGRERRQPTLAATLADRNYSTPTVC